MKIVSESTLERFRTPGPCEICGRRCARREPSHIMARGRSNAFQLDIPENLVASCRYCHARHHTTGGMLRTMLLIAADREGWSDADHLLAHLRRLRWTPKGTPYP